MFYEQYTVGFLNSIDVLGDKTFRSEYDLDRFLPFVSKFLSMPDLPSFGYLVYITYGVDYSSVCLCEERETSNLILEEH